MRWFSRRRAGRSADRVFIEGRRGWRQTIRRRLLIVLASFIVLAALSWIVPRVGGFMSGMFFGGAVALGLWAWDSPPPYLEKWRMGRDGERQTENELRPLARQGWHLFHDLPSGYRDTNIDHIALGPAGVFLLNSKNLWGSFAVEDGLLACHHEDTPASDYTLTRLHTQMHGAAYGLEQRLKNQLGSIVDVKPVVVLWAKFEQQHALLRDDVQVVRGNRIKHWLTQQPRKIAENDLAAIKDAIDALAPSPSRNLLSRLLARARRHSR